MSTLTLLPEWHPQSAVLLTWPHAGTDFKDNLTLLDKLYLDLTRAISRQSKVKILCFDEAHQNHIEELLVGANINESNYSLYGIKTNDIWIRDYGILTTSQMTALKFIFNAWGEKYDAALDNEAMFELWKQGGLPHHSLKTIPFVLEGGSIEVDGNGTLLTTMACLLSSTRNPEFTQSKIEEKLYECLGAQRFLWLHQGALEGDDTDSHIDMLARFCDPTTISYIRCEDKWDPHFTFFKKMKEELKTFRDHRGQPYDLVPLPFPHPKFSKEGKRLPASYANFLINNAQLIVPTYQDKTDDIALKQLEMCFPGKQIIPIDALALIEQYGSIHCATMQLACE